MKFPWFQDFNKPIQYAVIGIGRFGTSLVETLIGLGYEVLAIDPEEKNVERVRNIATYSAVIDVTDEKELHDAGITNVDVVVVCLSDLEMNILATLIVKELGIKYVIARGLNDNHVEILKLIGADWIVCPEKEMGKKIAQKMVIPGIIDLMDAIPEARLIEIVPTPDLVGKRIRELTLSRNGILVLGIRRDGNAIIVPNPEEIVRASDRIYLFGSPSVLEDFII
ncbi:MAG TPA: TrkA family potassium uptake protein [bacterium]|nr:TrkA family potassium uptake protein [bacterium]HOL54527.1 TrkA family potassium uptake protein [bacterium]HRR91695.1 TrkA family potassium uptake protein [bacterium]HRU32936.1 TrkA family potassium uptake protein [bacterium]